MNTIVVGVDGTRSSVSALRYALREAHAHGWAVRAVCAWHVPATAYGSGFAPVAPDPASFEKAAEDALRDALAATAGDADVPLETVVRQGDAVHVLLEESDDAAQLVVGCGGHGVVGRLLHHSVSGHCSRDAHCPVTVVHA